MTGRPITHHLYIEPAERSKGAKKDDYLIRLCRARKGRTPARDSTTKYTYRKYASEGEHHRLITLMANITRKGGSIRVFKPRSSRYD